MIPAWSALLCGVAATFLALRCHRHWRALFPEDPPNPTGRRQHLAPTPMAGSVPALLAVVGLLLHGAPPGLVVAVVLAAVTGLLDDRGKAAGAEMAWWHKGLLLGAATGASLWPLAESHALSVWALLAAAGWLFCLTNAVNFMDNTDGVSCSLGGLALLLVSGGEGALAWVGFGFLGFLAFNWPRAQAFLGDSGSLPLGMAVSWAALDGGLQATERVWSLEAVMPVWVFVADFLQVVVARLLIGVPPWQGDRRHLTHVTMNLGLPRVLVAPVFALVAWLVVEGV